MREIGRNGAAVALLVVLFAFAFLGTLAVPAQTRGGAAPPSAQEAPTPGAVRTPVAVLEAGAEQIIDAALRRMGTMRPVGGVQPTAMLARRVSVTELPGLGFAGVPRPFGDELRLWLLVLDGQFDARFLASGGGPSGQRGPVPPFEQAIVVYSETADTMVAARGTIGMFGLGCFFGDPTLPGGFIFCPPVTPAPTLAGTLPPPSPVFLPTSTPGPDTGRR